VDVDEFEGVHGRFRFGSRHVKGVTLLEFYDAINLAVANTWFKQGDSNLVNYEFVGCRTVVDYILIHQNE